MPDRRYTYTVEIDAAQARTAAQQLRQLFERELAQIMAKPSAGQPIDQALQRTQQTAEATKRTFEQISQIDLSASTEKLFEQLGKIDERLKATRNEYERMSQLKGSATSAQYRANMQTYYGEVAKAAGPEAEAAARLLGRPINVGQYGAEFKDDEAAHYGEAARDKYRMAVDDDQKRRFNTAEQQELARLEGEMYAAELDAVRVQKEMTARRLGDLEQQMNTLMAAGRDAEDETARIAAEADDVARSMAELGEQEADLLRSIESTNRRAAEQAEAAAAKAARQHATTTGQILSAGPSTPGAYTAQTALTVSSKSVENAEKLAAQMERTAEATERFNTAVQNAARRDWELDTLKQRAGVEQAARVDAQKQIEANRTAEAQKRAELQRTTNIQKAESAERVAITKAEAAGVAELHRQQTAKVRAEENRLTAQIKAELKEREAAARAAARAQQAGGIGGSGLPMGAVKGAALGVAGALGIYGVDQIARGTFDAGFQGAQQLRQMETFEALAQRVGVSSAVVVRAIREASRETITGTNAMGLAAQVLSQKFASTSQDISGDIETLVRFSRRASQIYTDESGAFLSTQDVFARLIKFAREGNKELVDQFGLSNKVIADALGITVDGLASADGAAKRWQGMLMLLNDEMQRLGESSVSTADKFEADIARIDEAWNRIKRSMAAPVSAVVTAAADFTEGASIKTGGAGPDEIRRFVEQSNAEWAKLGKGSIAGFDELLATLDKLDAASAKNAESTKQYGEEIRAMGQAIINSNGAIGDTAWFAGPGEEQIARLEQLQRALELIAAGQDAYSYAMQATTKKGIEENATLAQMAAGMGRMQNAYESGAITLEQYNAAMISLTDAMRNASEAAGILSTGAEQAADKVAKITTQSEEARDTLLRLASQMAAGLSLDAVVNVRTANTNPLLQDILDRSGATLNLPGVYTGQRDPFSGMPTGELIRSLAGAQTGLLGLSPGMKDVNDQERQDVYGIREERRRADEAAARKAASEWESAAKKAQSAFEAAARDTANEFKSALEAVPGLFGTSEVTAQDMEAAKLGFYQNKADERLRVLADEVLNRKDTPEDPADWARRLGLDPGTDPKRVLAEAQARWADSSLFAGGANLDLINRDAIMANLARQDASKAGRDALLKEFGLGESSPLDEAGKGALKEMLGLGEQELTSAGSEARAAFDAGFYAPAAKGATAATGEEAAGMAATLAQQLKTDIEAGEVADALYSIGGSILGRIHAGYEAAAATANWSDALIESLAADVAPLVAEALADQLPPKP